MESCEEELEGEELSFVSDIITPIKETNKFRTNLQILPTPSTITFDESLTSPSAEKYNNVCIEKKPLRRHGNVSFTNFWNTNDMPKGEDIDEESSQVICKPTYCYRRRIQKIEKDRKIIEKKAKKSGSFTKKWFNEFYMGEADLSEEEEQDYDGKKLATQLEVCPLKMPGEVIIDEYITRLAIIPNKLFTRSAYVKTDATSCTTLLANVIERFKVPIKKIVPNLLVTPAAVNIRTLGRFLDVKDLNTNYISFWLIDILCTALRKCQIQNVRSENQTTFLIWVAFIWRFIQNSDCTRVELFSYLKRMLIITSIYMKSRNTKFIPRPEFIDYISKLPIQPDGKKLVYLELLFGRKFEERSLMRKTKHSSNNKQSKTKKPSNSGKKSKKKDEQQSVRKRRKTGATEGKRLSTSYQQSVRNNSNLSMSNGKDKLDSDETSIMEELKHIGYLTTSHWKSKNILRDLEVTMSQIYYIYASKDRYKYLSILCRFPQETEIWPIDGKIRCPQSVIPNYKLTFDVENHGEEVEKIVMAREQFIDYIEHIINGHSEAASLTDDFSRPNTMFWDLSNVFRFENPSKLSEDESEDLDFFDGELEFDDLNDDYVNYSEDEDNSVDYVDDWFALRDSLKEEGATTIIYYDPDLLRYCNPLRKIKLSFEDTLQNRLGEDFVMPEDEDSGFMVADDIHSLTIFPFVKSYASLKGERRPYSIKNTAMKRRKRIKKYKEWINIIDEMFKTTVSIDAPDVLSGISTDIVSIGEDISLGEGLDDDYDEYGKRISMGPLKKVSSGKPGSYGGQKGGKGKSKQK